MGPNKVLYIKCCKGRIRFKKQTAGKCLVRLGPSKKQVFLKVLKSNLSLLMVRKRKKKSDCYAAQSSLCIIERGKIAMDNLIYSASYCGFEVCNRDVGPWSKLKILPPFRKLQGTVTRRLMAEILSAFNSAVGSPFSCPHCCLKNQEREPGTKDLMSRSGIKRNNNKKKQRLTY